MGKMGNYWTDRIDELRAELKAGHADRLELIILAAKLASQLGMKVGLVEISQLGVEKFQDSEYVRAIVFALPSGQVAWGLNSTDLESLPELPPFPEEVNLAEDDLEPVNLLKFLSVESKAEPKGRGR